MHVPAADRWTAADLDHLPENGLRYEVLNGQLIVGAVPTPSHQLMVTRLGRLLDDAAPEGLCMIPGVGVLVGEDEAIPDLLVCTGPVPLDARGIPAVQVRLAVEVVSRSTAAMDRRIKPDLYAEGRISNFWRIETSRFKGQSADEELPVLLAYELVGDEYAEVARCSAGNFVTLTSPCEITFDPAVLRH